LSPDELRAAAETHRELPPEYQTAVIESFLDKIGSEIDARVDARLATYAHQGSMPKLRRPPRQHSPAFLAIVSMIIGIPLTAIMAGSGSHPVGLAGVLVVWAAIVAINIANSPRFRPPGDRH
jgi:cation transporter-like permease